MKRHKVMDITVCIVNWNTKELIKECIDSIVEKTRGVDYEIVIVDNNSTDGSKSMIAEFYPDCKLIASSSNLGFVKGNNLAVKQATGRYILYLNPDTKLVTNALYGMFSFLEANREYGAAGCRLINVDGSIQYTCASTFPGPFNEFCRYMLLDRLFPRSEWLSSRLLEYWDHRNSRSVDCLSGACMMVRRELVSCLQGFDENIFMYAEDLDLCYRIIQTRSKIYYLFSEVIIHKEGSSSVKHKNSLFAPLLQCHSGYYFVAKHHGSFKALQYRLAICIGALFRTVILVLLTPVLNIEMSGSLSARETVNKYWNIVLWSVGAVNINKVIQGKSAS